MQVAKIGSNDLNSKSNGYADLWRASKADKIENYDVLINLNVKNISDEFHLTLAFENNLLSNINTVILSSFRVGDTAIFYPTPDPEVLNPLRSQILKCRVISVNYDTIEISLINKQVNKDYFRSSNFWALERDFRENSYKQQLQLMYQFLKSDKRVIDLVLGIERPQFSTDTDILQSDLDPVQHENVKNAINANDYYLIQGPPGTGKTSKVLVEIVRNLSIKDTDIMVVAFTNRAVDEICEKLLALGVECIRLGRGEKPYYWSYLSNNLKLDDFNARIDKNKIFVSTISTFASSLDILKFKKFETLIVDEASQVLESQITGVLKYFKRWIFIGDENQLPAVVVQNKKDSLSDSKELKELSLTNFRESLFYRLKKNAVKKSWNDCHGMLKFQYRMHEDVAEFSKKYFYNDQLEINTEKQKAPLLKGQGKGDPLINEVFYKSRVIFIPTKADLTSKINNEEATLTAALIQQISTIYGDQFDQAKTVGVITPFRAQIANIRNKLNIKYRDVTIDTVERFQGSERDIIIISLATKSTTQFSAIQSMNEEGVDRKLNVALTRAKERVIILGCEEVLQNSPLFKMLIAFIKERGGYMVNPLKAKSIPTDLF
jgi:DNA replication ATP-dependent helicase Dna2